MAMDLVSWTIAPFAALYEGTSPDPKNEYILPMLMIFPPLLLTIDRAASFERRKTALSWVSMTLSQSSGFSCNTPPLNDTLPALFTRMPMHRVRARPGSVRAPIRRDCYIHLHRDRRSADCFQFRKHPLVLFVVSSKHRDGSACLGQSERNATANSAIATSHHSHPAG